MKNKLTTRVHNNRVLVINNGKTILDIPWQVASQFGRVLQGMANQAEQFDNIEKTIQDGAILHRAGMPFNLIQGGKAAKEIVKTAQHDRNLRRYMPNGIKSSEVFGVPQINQTGPKR